MPHVFFGLLIFFCVHAILFLCSDLDLSMVDVAAPCIALLLQSPFCGTSDANWHANERHQHRLQGKWHLPCGMRDYLASLAPGGLDVAGMFANPGTISALVICVPFIGHTHPAELDGDDFKFHLRDYYFRVRHAPLHTILWSTVVRVIWLSESVLADQPVSFHSAPKGDVFAGLPFTSPLARRAGVVCDRDSVGNGSLCALIHALRATHVGFSGTVKYKGVEKFVHMQLPCPWLFALLFGHVCTLSTSDAWYKITHGEAGFDLVAKADAPVRTFLMQVNTRGPPTDAGNSNLLLSLSNSLFRAASMYLRGVPVDCPHSKQEVLWWLDCISRC